VTLAVGAGDVTIEVPTGTYRCVLSAGGTVDTTGITCDDAAPAVLDVQVEAGDLKVTGL
jgi:hypothetical protein